MSDKKCTLCDAVRMFKKEGLDDADALAKAVEWFYDAEIAQYNVVERDGRWCVVHGHADTGGSRDAPKGTVIKCFDSKEKAMAMHAAIMANKGK